MDKDARQGATCLQMLTSLRFVMPTPSEIAAMNREIAAISSPLATVQVPGCQPGLRTLLP
jgi:hypothetical protein